MILTFHDWLGRRSTAVLLDRMLADNARVDEEEKRRRAENEATYEKAVASFWKKTDEVS